MKLPHKILASAILAIAAQSDSAIDVTSSLDATALVNALAGPGITISNASLTTATATAAGTFTNGGDLGIASGVVLTTGTVACVPGPNRHADCMDIENEVATTSLAALTSTATTALLIWSTTD